MKCNLIFYLSNKTSYSQIALSRCLKQTDYRLDNVKGATTPSDLGKALCEFLGDSDVCFLIGGLKKDGKKGTKSVLSRAIANKNIPPQNIARLSNSECANDGYAIKCGKQLIVALPDEPGEIMLLFDETLCKYLNKFSQMK